MFFPSSGSWVCLPALGLGGSEEPELRPARAGGGTAGTVLPRLSELSPLWGCAKELLPGDILLSSLPAISRKSKSIA